MDQIYELLAITLGAILANNFIFSQFLGICPFLGVSKKVDTAVGMGIAVTFVMGLASAVCYAVNEFVLVRYELEYMQTVTFILVIACPGPVRGDVFTEIHAVSVHGSGCVSAPDYHQLRRTGCGAAERAEQL